MGKNFKGVFHLANDCIHLFSSTHGGKIMEGEVIQGLNNPRLDELWGVHMAAQVREEIELVRGASHEFDHDAYLRGEVTPLSILSDPMGWGWNLLGTAGTTWNPDVSVFSPVFQAALLLAGLYMAGKTAARQSAVLQGKTRWTVLSLMAFCLMFTLTMLWLLVG